MATSKRCPVLELNGNSAEACVGSKKGRQTECQTSTGTDRTQRWSKEVLEAMETHLSLLKRGASRKLAARTEKNCMDEREDSHCSSRTDERATARRVHCLENKKGPLVELSSKAPLPDGWEQFLDLRTGQVYYVDWKSFKRSYIDPRTVLQLANDRASSFFKQAWSGREHQSAVTNSECLTDCSSYVAKNGSGNEMEVDSKWTAPMYEEDWNLMKSRGWLWSRSDASRSEISTEVCSPALDQSSSSSCGAESEGIVKMAVKGCHQCLSYSMSPEISPWCPHCGDALV